MFSQVNIAFRKYPFQILRPEIVHKVRILVLIFQNNFSLMDFLLFNELDALLNTLDLVLILIINLKLFPTLAFGVKLASFRV